MTKKELEPYIGKVIKFKSDRTRHSLPDYRIGELVSIHRTEVYEGSE